MWLMLLLAVVVCVIVLYVPGYLLARSLSVARFASVAVAPLLSVFLVSVLGILLYEVGIACSAPVLLAPAVAFCLVAFLVGRALSRGTRSHGAKELMEVDDAKEAFRTAALYVAVAFVIAFVVYILAIDGPESFSRNDDTTVHLSVVRSFLDTGTYSTLHVSSYLEQGVGDISFYPAAWHVVTAIVASFFGDAVTLASNATVITFAVFVFPLGMCLLFLKLFGRNKRVVLAGSLFVLAFSGFPWGFVVFGQLLSNMVAFILIPPTLVALMDAVDDGRVSARIRLGLVVCAGLAAIALSQPNGAFTFGIWAVLYGVSRIFFSPKDDSPRVTSKHVAAAVALFAVACAVWAAMYFAPFMQRVVQNTWEATLSPIEAIGAGLLFMFTTREGIQPFLSVVVLIGVVYTCKHRRYLWLTVAFAFSMLTYMIGVSTDGVLKHVLSGFWYTDYYRTAAMTALFAIPLAALGFAKLTDFARMWCARALKLQEGSARYRYMPVVVLMALMLVCQFFPLHTKLSEKAEIGAGLVKIHREVSARYSWDQVYTGEEDAFVRQVMDVIPEGALVVNVPSDGSCWSYGVDGINTYFRRSSNIGRGSEEESKILRTQLCDVATSEEVRQLVDDLDARYVMMLDDMTGENRTTLKLRYKEENWQGIQSIDEETPGFKLVLSEGDMRLYQIED